MQALLWIAIIALTSSLIVIPLVAGRLRQWGLTRRNFRDQRVLTGAGVAVVASLGASIVAIDVLDIEGFNALPAWRHLGIVALFCAIGLIDDILGDRSVVGLTAHVQKLIQERRVTAGLFKAVVGLLIAVVVGLNIADGEVWPGLVNAMLLALTANFVNLFDVRPGRGLKLYWALTLVGLLLATTDMRLAVVPLVLASVVIYPADAHSRSMLGDSGALALGASSGLLLIDGLGSTLTKFVLVLVLLVVTVLAEFRSPSSVIGANPVLAYLDHLGVPAEEGEETPSGAPAR